MSLKIGIMHEASIANGGRERRVALTPDAIGRLEKKLPGVAVIVESGAGVAAGFSDAAYEVAGASVVKAFKDKIDVLLRVTTPDANTKLPVREGGVVVCLTTGADSWKSLAAGGVNVLALEKLPRTSRAQAMDVLSSQANLGGYAAVLGAVQKLPRLMPMLMTSAGSSKPANVLVLGVGVAGLQAIATARRLGAQVKAFDVRPEVGEQILSLGAKPVVLDDASVAVEGKGGYAGAMDAAGLLHLQNLLAPFIAEADVVISTAQVPGKAAPVLISADVVTAMKAGSVIVDMAAGGFNKANGVNGGNCPLSRADETVEAGHGVSILGETNWPSMVAGDASRFWAQNMVNLLGAMVVDGKLSFEDELVKAMHVNAVNS